MDNICLIMRHSRCSNAIETTSYSDSQLDCTRIETGGNWYIKAGMKMGINVKRTGNYNGTQNYLMRMAESGSGPTIGIPALR